MILEVHCSIKCHTKAEMIITGNVKFYFIAGERKET